MQRNQNRPSSCEGTSSIKWAIAQKSSFKKNAKLSIFIPRGTLVQFQTHLLFAWCASDYSFQCDILFSYLYIVAKEELSCALMTYIALLASPTNPFTEALPTASTVLGYMSMTLNARTDSGPAEVSYHSWSLAAFACGCLNNTPFHTFLNGVGRSSTNLHNIMRGQCKSRRRVFGSSTNSTDCQREQLRPMLTGQSCNQTLNLFV